MVLAEVAADELSHQNIPSLRAILQHVDLLQQLLRFSNTSQHFWRGAASRTSKELRQKCPQQQGNERLGEVLEQSNQDSMPSI